MCIHLHELFTSAHQYSVYVLYKRFTKLMPKYLPVLNACACLHRKGSQIPKCSQVLNARVCFMEKVHKCQDVHKSVNIYPCSMHVCACIEKVHKNEMPKCSQISECSMHVCASWRMFTNAKMFTNTYQC